jgi:hypothetical protein
MRVALLPNKGMMEMESASRVHCACAEQSLATCMSSSLGHVQVESPRVLQKKLIVWWLKAQKAHCHVIPLTLFVSV